MNFQNFSKINTDFEPAKTKNFKINTMTMNDIYTTPFLMTQDHRKDFTNMAETALKGIHNTSDMSKLYFSDNNMKRLQKMLKKAVLKKSCGKYILAVDQDRASMLIVMKAVYLEHAKFLPNQIVRQVKNLNNKVIQELLPGVLSNIKQYFGYLEDINTPIKPIDRPINVGSKGRTQLPSVTTIWNI